MLLAKQNYESYNQAPPLFEIIYIDLCSSYSLLQLHVVPRRTIERTKTLIDHILTKSPKK